MSEPSTSKDHPLLKRIEGIDKHGQTGSLRLAHGDSHIDIHFKDGAIHACSSNLKEFRLGQYMLKAGFVGAPQLEKLLTRASKRGASLGEAALSQGVLTPPQLSRLVQRQAYALLTRCLENGFNIQTFEEKRRSFAVSVPISIEDFFLELARRHPAPLEVGRNQQIRLTSETGIPSLSWSPEELAVLGQLKSPQTLESLTTATRLPEDELDPILKTLSSLGLIQVSMDLPGNTTALANKERFPLELLVPHVTNSLFSEKLEVFRNPSSFISEQFASLKVQIEGLDQDPVSQVLAISSAHAKDGKSLLATNLALSFANDPGKRVVLLDCDLRNPSIHDYLGISIQPGVVNYLTNERLEPFCYMRRLGSLFVITAGGVADNPIGLLSHERMLKLMDFLRQEFDTILVDSPPLLPISDTRVVSRLVDRMVLVVRRGKTPYRLAEKAFANLDRSKFLGVVFNDVKARPLHTYYDYKYYQSGTLGNYPYQSRQGGDPSEGKSGGDS